MNRISFVPASYWKVEREFSVPRLLRNKRVRKHPFRRVEGRHIGCWIVIERWIVKRAKAMYEKKGKERVRLA